MRPSGPMDPFGTLREAQHDRFLRLSLDNFRREAGQGEQWHIVRTYVESVLSLDGLERATVDGRAVLQGRLTDHFPHRPSLHVVPANSLVLRGQQEQ